MERHQESSSQSLLSNSYNSQRRSHGSDSEPDTDEEREEREKKRYGYSNGSDAEQEDNDDNDDQKSSSSSSSSSSASSSRCCAENVLYSCDGCDSNGLCNRCDDSDAAVSSDYTRCEYGGGGANVRSS